MAVLSVSVYHLLSGVFRSWKRVFDPLGLALQTVVSHHVDSGNQIHVLWKSTQCSYLLSHLFQP